MDLPLLQQPASIGHYLVKFPVIEHVIPRAQGGANTLVNLVLSCPECNSQKGARTPLEWLGVPCCDRHAT